MGEISKIGNKNLMLDILKMTNESYEKTLCHIIDMINVIIDD